MCCYADMSLASPLISSWRLSHSCYAQCLSPQNWENKTSTAMQRHKGVYCQLKPGLPSHPAQWSLDESPEPRFTAVFISLEQRQGVGKGWLAAGGSWYFLIGQSSSLWLARVIIILIGQSYHLSDWPELPSLLLARVTISGSPASMTQGLFLAQCTSLSLSWLWWGCNTSQYREGWKWTRSAVSDSLRPRGL